MAQSRRIHLEHGPRAEAFRLLWPLAQDPHRGETSEDAAALLEEAQPLPDDTEAPDPAP